MSIQETTTSKKLIYVAISVGTPLLIWLLFASSIRSAFGNTDIELPIERSPIWTSDEFLSLESIAWGDIDGDGDLDLAAGGAKVLDVFDPSSYVSDTVKLYTFDNGELRSAPTWESDETMFAFSMAWGDMDGDGDLDLAVGHIEEIVIFENVNGTLSTSPKERIADFGLVYGLDWGDVDNDGDLDLAAGSIVVTIHYNQNGTFADGLKTFGEDIFPISDLAFGDANNDGYLDLAVAPYSDTLKIYTNLSGVFEASASWQTSEFEYTGDVAWGDVDRDGDLDLAFSRFDFTFMPGILTSDFIFTGTSDIVFLNESGEIDTVPDWESDETHYSDAISWADVDGDGYLDLTASSRNHTDGVDIFGQSTIYYNDLGSLQTSSSWQPILNFEGDQVSSDHAWGDYDGDGDLDWANGSPLFDPIEIHASFALPFNQNEDILLEKISTARDIHWGDIDGDGDPDLAIAHVDGADGLYLNQNGRIEEIPFWQSGPSETSYDIKLVDVDNDFDKDLVVGTQSTNKLYLNQNGTFSPTPSWESSERFDSVAIDLADVDGDLDLDLMVVDVSTVSGQNGRLRLYRFDAQSNQFSAQADWEYEAFNEVPFSVDFGDVDLDGDPDLALGSSERNKLFLNRRGDLSATPDWESIDIDATVEIRWGDINGDGYPDLVAGNEGLSKVYSNAQGQLATKADWVSDLEGETKTILLEDLDQDGDLDVIQTNRSALSGSNHNIFINENGALNPNPIDFGFTFTPDTSVESADIDGDGDIDLIFSEVDNTVSIFKSTLADLSLLPNSSPAVKINDIRLEEGQAANETLVDVHYQLSDAELDPIGSVQGYFSIDGGRSWRLAVATEDTRTSTLRPLNMPSNGLRYHWSFDEGSGSILLSEVYTTAATYPFGPTFTQSSPINSSYSQYALEFDGKLDGLDLPLQSSLVTEGSFALSFWYQPLTTPDADTPIAVYSGDGGAAGRFALYHEAASNKIRLTYTGADCTTASTYLSAGSVTVGSWANVTLLLNDTFAAILINGEGDVTNLPDTGCQNSGKLQVGYDDAGLQYNHMRIDDVLVYDRLLNTGEVQTILNRQREYIYRWDTTASGFFGRSEEVLFRLEAYTTADSSKASQPGTYLYYGSTGYPSNPFPSVSNTAGPFRLQGLQLRVVDEAGNPVEGALVYQIKAGETVGELFANPQNRQPYQTDASGFLTGRGEIFSGSQIVALAPITSSHKYTIYHTSAVPSTAGLNTDTVSNGQIQTIAVSKENPLLVYNPIVSLEWDARGDDTFLGQLENGIKRASQVMYDATNGQAVIGNVGIYHDKGLWEAADIIIRASNRSRPSAILGGSVLTRTVETLELTEELASQLDLESTQIESVYLPGQISMPPRWGQFGTGSGDLGEDWARTLAHEFGHYLFFLPDNYLGLDGNLNLTLVDCPGSIMDNPYLDQNSEFADPETFAEGCQGTLASQFFDQSDWEIITTHYPFFNQPSGKNEINSGPSTLPLAITQVSFFEPPEASNGLENRFFPIVDSEQNPLFLPVGKTEGFLMKNVDNDDPSDDYLIELGSVNPSGAFLEAWGVEPGDQLCLFDYSGEIIRQGCVSNIGNSPTPIRMLETPDWAPELTILSVSTNTLQIEITNGSTDLEVQLVTPVGRSSEWVQVSDNQGKLEAEVTAPDGAFYGYVRVRQTIDSTLTRELIVPFTNLEAWDGKTFSWGSESYTWDGKTFSWGGKTFSWGGKTFSWGGKTFSWGGKTFSWGGKTFSWGGKTFSWGAPTSSPDGQLSVFPIRGVFDDTQAFTISRINLTPGLPGHLTSVGQTYRLIQSTELSDEASILFSYLSRDVLGGSNNEQYIRIYYLPDGENQSWTKLETTLDVDRNIAVSKAKGDGLYVLAMAREIGPLKGGAWNQLSYPNERSEPVANALAGVEGKFSAIYQPPTLDNPTWLLFAPTVETDLAGLVNSLSELSFGSYWIYMTEDVNPGLIPVDYSDTRSIFQFAEPPMTIYGSAVTGSGLELGDSVEAVIGSTVCGQGKIVDHNGNPAYKIEISAATLTTNVGCGQPGALVTLQSGSLTLSEPFLWNSANVQRLNLDPAAPLQSIGRIYLPMINKR